MDEPIPGHSWSLNPGDFTDPTVLNYLSAHGVRMQALAYKEKPNSNIYVFCPCQNGGHNLKSTDKLLVKYMRFFKGPIENGDRLVYQHAKDEFHFHIMSKWDKQYISTDLSNPAHSLYLKGVFEEIFKWMDKGYIIICICTCRMPYGHSEYEIAYILIQHHS